jgi:uncharacterized membrane protein
MSQLSTFFLTIHVLTAIVAFGPSFAFPLIARMAAQEPQHGLFALRLTDLIERRIVIPAALAMPVSGLLLVWSEGIDLMATHWLVLSTALFVVAVGFAILVQLPTIERMVEVAGRMSASAAVLAAGRGAELTSAAVQVAGRTAGADDPAAAMAALGARARVGGIILSLMVVAIVTLMAAKPAF